MDEKPDQILGHIEAQRDELGRNLSELETRVRRGTDWKTYFDRNPMMMLGVALGGGLLLGTAVGNKRKNRGGYNYSSGTSSSSLGFASAGAMGGASSSWRNSRSSHTSQGSQSSSQPSPVMAAQRQQVSETMEHIKAALIGFGIAKAKEFMAQAIPGFDHHMSEAERKHQGQRSNVGGFAGESGAGTSSSSHGQGAASGQHSWESDAYGSGGHDNSGTYGNMGGSDYRGSHSQGEPVGAGTTPNVTP